MENKSILLISNEVFHYRERIYNTFYRRFYQDGYIFQVASDKFQNVGIEFQFQHYELPFTISNYFNLIRSLRPEYVILFLHLKDKIMFPIIFYCKAHHIPVIYWNHGINIKDPNNKIKNAIFHLAHNLCDALITYTPDMKKNFSQKNQKKLFVAYNTLDFTNVHKEDLPSAEDTRTKYRIKQRVIVLYASRFLDYKKPELLAKLFGGNKDIAVVFVGPGITDELRLFIDEHENLYYLGEKYGDEVDAIYKASDIFSTPGHIGLAMNQALFWGLPVVILRGIHAPEIYYMKDGITGYVVDSEDELKERIIELSRDDELRKQMSERSLILYNKEVSIDKMYEGFINAIYYCEHSYNSCSQ